MPPAQCETGGPTHGTFGSPEAPHRDAGACLASRLAVQLPGDSVALGRRRGVAWQAGKTQASGLARAGGRLPGITRHIFDDSDYLCLGCSPVRIWNCCSMGYGAATAGGRRYSSDQFAMEEVRRGCRGGQRARFPYPRVHFRARTLGSPDVSAMVMNAAGAVKAAVDLAVVADDLGQRAALTRAEIGLYASHCPGRPLQRQRAPEDPF
jgi:hypothetical protein